jgi:hypothetical protein
MQTPYIRFRESWFFATFSDLMSGCTKLALIKEILNILHQSCLEGKTNDR